MNKRVLVIISLLLVSVTAVACCFFINGQRRVKGGEDAHTVFDIDGTELIISDGKNDKTISGVDRQNLISMFKDVFNNGEDATKADSYDIVVDFGNGYRAKISTEEKVFSFLEDEKRMSDDDVSVLTEYLKK